MQLGAGARAVRLKFKARSEGWQALQAARFPSWAFMCMLPRCSWGWSERQAAGAGARSGWRSGHWVCLVGHPSAGSEFPSSHGWSPCRLEWKQRPFYWEPTRWRKPGALQCRDLLLAGPLMGKAEGGRVPGFSCLSQPTGGWGRGGGDQGCYRALPVLANILATPVSVSQEPSSRVEGCHSSEGG